jgi:hypothetical protein
MSAIRPFLRVAPVCFALLGFAQSSAAETTRGATAAAAGSLHFAPQQEAEINRLSHEESESFLAIVRDPALTADQRLAKGRAVHRAFMAAVEALMSPGQRAAGRVPLVPIHAWPLPDAIARLRLAGEQQAQMEALAQDAIKAHNEIVASVALSDPQKWIALEAKQAAVREKCYALLTPAQRSLLQSGVRIEINRPLLAAYP